MANITVRNIPEEVFEKIKALSAIERRSLNNQILTVLERGTFSEYEEVTRERRHISKQTQLQMWRELCGSWEDDRTAKEIIKDIYSHRTLGRDVQI